MIVLQWNNLTGKIPTDLANNNLTGKIPLSLGNLSSLTIFSFHENNLEGSIPNQMSQIKSLKIFTAGGNRLSGNVFPSLFNITSLSFLGVDSNQLRGNLTNNIFFFLPNLQTFAIGINYLSGLISDSLSNASQLQVFDFSSNKFVGQVPTDLENLKSLSWLNFETNNLESNSSNDLVFLTSLINCSHLEMLSFSMDHFGGVIPNSITNLSTRLNYLYLGENEITGTVPVGLENLINLIGKVPKRGVFANVSALSLIGNNKLCGGVPELGLPKCPTRITKKVNSHTLMLAIAIACGVPSVVLILMLFLICWMKKLRSNSSFASLAMNHLLNVSYKDLYQATNGFSSCNLIGSGFFSSVYKGFLPQVERQVAIKVLNLEQTGAIKEIIHSMRNHSGRDGWMVLKIDLEKAYDQLR
ncbi:putative receptor-like protein kinase At3g47110 [Manihot esculenta]|uniref:putative receptor-like protein kinase At3g47110 n=1 Tax=Manihot esculenta TaxID=3983 RepID=UPI001CC7BC20|nr:putative receptor-like protein kinase At3g47110 [Manihot esculenta]